MAEDSAVQRGVPERLRFLRRRAGLTQEQLSQRSKVSRRTLIRWETGMVSPWIPELTAALRALDASDEEVQELMRMLGTTRAHRERRDVPLDGIGRVLKTFRLRSGLSTERLASRMGVNPTTVGRWESGALYPDEDALRRLLECLGVHPQEAEALPFVGDQFSSEADWEEELDGIRWWWDEWAYVLLDVRFLDLIFRLRAAAVREPAFATELGRGLAAYSNALSNCHRFAEADAYAAEAAEMLGESRRAPEALTTAILVRARCAAYGSSRRRYRQSIQHLDSLASLPLDREFLSWRLAAYAECHGRHGQMEEALRIVGEAVALTDGHLEEAHALRRFDRARLLLSAARPEEALGEMPPIKESTPGNIASEALLWSEALSLLGRGEDAEHWRSVALRNIADYHLAPVFRRQGLPFTLPK